MARRIGLLGYRALNSLRTHGVSETCRRAARYFLSGVGRVGANQDLFDATYGTDTGGISPVWDLDTDSANARYGERYQAIPADELDAALSFLHKDWSAFTFVDLGCGKGRALIAASQHGFARVIGVEFAKSLVDIAIKNSKIAGVRVEVRNEDAAQFEFPEGDIIVFMFNPFRETVMRQVMCNLARHQGKLYLLYYRPEQSAVIDERTDFLAKIGQIPTAPGFCVWQGVAGACEGCLERC
ncbi:SAM-dependent methyltransferase [Bradyrhizobium sp. USDA 326]